MIGRVVKIFSDFYYVETEKGIVEAKLRTVLKKQKAEVYTGDYVKLEQLDENSLQAFVAEVVERKTLISRPKVANVTQAIIVSALKEPDLNYEQLDRYIAHCEYHNIKPVLCFNKEDIEDTDDLKENIINTYPKLGYDIVFTSALNKTGLEELRPILKWNTSILCGASGVGKSSLINALLNNSKLKTQPVSDKTKKGVHTTRHCEILDLDSETFIVDTPGFSHLKFDFLLPSQVITLFSEFRNQKSTCKYKNCLHIDEDGCGYQDIIKLMAGSRIESYKKFVAEAKEYEEKISKISIKNEARVKYNKNKMMTKISNKKRSLSRKVINQNIYKDEFDNE
ncbi:ribosome small subunit-dependent GTPase A [bacterium]|nr:ribosome small subunit-dependent GTPase A [bacterium]